MTEHDIELVGNCPTWCRSVSAEGDLHAHVSEDLTVGDGAEPTVVRMLQLAGSDQVRITVREQALDLEEAYSLAHALLRLVADAQMAEPGLGFVEVLATQAGVSTGEMALAAGLDADRVRAHRAGGQVLSKREFDRLALAVAQLLPLTSTSALGGDQHGRVVGHHDLDGGEPLVGEPLLA
jgi:hypothetical protein